MPNLHANNVLFPHDVPSHTSGVSRRSDRKVWSELRGLRRGVWLGLVLLISGCAWPGREGAVPQSVAAAHQLSQRGIVAMQKGDWNQAETLLADAVQKSPTDIEARRQYAETLWHRGRRTEALVQIDAAIKNASEDTTLWIRSGEMSFELGNRDEALRRADEALALDPESATAWTLRGRVTQSLPEGANPLADYHKAIGFRHDDPKCLLQTAEIYRQQGNAPMALVTLQSLLDTYPPGEEPQSVLFLQGQAFMSLGRNEDAVDAFSLALQRGPASAELYCRLGAAKLLIGRFAEAQSLAQQALALDPKHEASRTLLDRVRLAQQSNPTTRR